jgi:N-formylglutamate amidohydrolase
MMPLWDLHRGDGPLIVRRSACRDVRAARHRCAPHDRGQAWPDTDWHVEKLYAFARDEGATFCARRIRAMSST